MVCFNPTAINRSQKFPYCLLSQLKLSRSEYFISMFTGLLRSPGFGADGYFVAIAAVFVIFSAFQTQKYKIFENICTMSSRSGLRCFIEILIYSACSCFFSTREIKPNQTDIGRKITKKPSAITPSLYSRTTTSGQTSSTTPNSLIANGNKRQLDSSERGPSSSDGQQQQLQQQQTQQSSLSHLTSQQQISANSSHSYNTNSSQDHHQDPYHNSALNGVVGDDVDHQRTTSSMGHNLSRNNGQQNHRNPDIMRKPIKWVANFEILRSRVIYASFLQGKTYTLISIKAI